MLFPQLDLETQHVEAFGLERKVQTPGTLETLSWEQNIVSRLIADTE